MEKKMVEIKKTVKQMDMRVVFTGIDSHQHHDDIQKLRAKIHAMRWQVYWDRMKCSHFDDSVDVLATYGGARQ